MNIKRSILIRVRVAFLFVLLFAIAVIVKISRIQFVEGEKWKAIGEATTFDYMKVRATRGNIYSDNGSLLATDLPFYEVAFDPSMASDEIFNQAIDSLSLLLSQYYKDKSPFEYKRFLKEARSAGRQYIIINHDQINYHARKMMEEWPLFREGRYRGGIIFEKIDVRYRPFSNLSRRTIGYVNDNGNGAGLEYSFNDILAGIDGEALFQKIAGSTWKPVFDANNIKSVDGLDIHTTLDVNLQDVAETALHNAMQKHHADEGTVVVMEVQTGEVKAISNLTRDGDGYYEKYNHAVGGLYEPGSTYKLVTMMALLEEADIKLSDSIETGNGEYSFYNKTVRDHHEGGFGTITIKQAFELSSNVAMAKLADFYFSDRPETFVGYTHRLHLDMPLGGQIRGELYPKIPQPKTKSWSGISLPWMAYGYGLEISPMHTLAVYNAVANDGRMIKPIFVTAISKAGQVVNTFETETINPKICSGSTLNQLRLLLEGVVDHGTAENLKNSNCRIAGKTGTSQILENGEYTSKYITSFVGYFPANAPKYSAIVLIKNPKGWQQYGNNVAGPVFKAIADNIYARDIQLHMAMEEKKVLEPGVFPVIRAGQQMELTMLCNELGVSNHSTTNDKWVRAVRSNNAVLWEQNVPNKNLIPDVTGMTYRDALYLLESMGLKVNHDGKGRVAEQSLPPGTLVTKGNRIHLTLG